MTLVQVVKKRPSKRQANFDEAPPIEYDRKPYGGSFGRILRPQDPFGCGRNSDRLTVIDRKASYGRTGTQIKLLASEMIPKELCPYFGSHMSSDRGRSHFSPIAKWGSNNFLSKLRKISVFLTFFTRFWFFQRISKIEKTQTYLVSLNSIRYPIRFKC